MITEIEVKLLEKSEELLFLRGVCMKIGLRTVKTAISAALAMIIAEKLGLLYAPSAGIISVLSVTSTKKTSVMTGIYRLLSLALATILAYICFTFWVLQRLLLVFFCYYLFQQLCIFNYLMGLL